VRLFSDVASQVDDVYFARALELAARARGATAPNPLVGCVVVSEGRVVGEGFHQRAGEPHAEVVALREAGAAARGADVYVTLEPCAHHGRTPPCVDALVAAGVSRVFVGMPDPTTLAGGGADRLRDAGIAVAFAEDTAPFEDLNEGWIRRVGSGVPFVRVKVGVSLDGCVALERGARSSMTGASGADVTCMLRDRSDAVLVSAATVDADDPALTARNGCGELLGNQPVRVVLARHRLPALGAKVMRDDAAPTILLVSDAIEQSDLAELPDTVERVTWPCDSGLDGALRALAGRGVGELLVEPGPRLFSALWRARAIDELVVVTAGGVAGSDAPSFYVGSGEREGDALFAVMSPRESSIVGDVSVVVWRPSQDNA
jgi:diaminohydroxyphosphoribosylaminopyrimidine deaminase / 5-amino-6-(5-phosphoribosylamino)uracil reductase